MATRNEVTKKLKTGQRVKILGSFGWALIAENGHGVLVATRERARAEHRLFKNLRIVRLNPITGVVSK